MSLRPDPTPEDRKLFVGRPRHGQIRQRYVGRLSEDGQHIEFFVHADGGEHLPLPLRQIIGDEVYDLREMIEAAARSFRQTPAQIREFLEGQLARFGEGADSPSTPLSGSECPVQSEAPHAHRRNRHQRRRAA
jgi:hypothetical protein